MTKPVRILQENIDVDNFDDAELPSDVHYVTYKTKDEKLFVDAVRAYTKADTFDFYYDKLKNADELTGLILSIESGHGRIRPNLYGKIKEEE